MKQYIEKCLNGEHLTAEEAGSALEVIMTGQATDVQVAGLLVALRAKGETVEEIVGFARTMRAHSLHVNVEDPDAIDMCGTGGDGKGTFNISTVAAFVAAGAGVTVAKHGNRSVSSRSGSADILAALGVNIQLPPQRVQECINGIGIGFLFAPSFHPAMKHAAKARGELAVRTIFNILGPMTNPGRVRRQLVGTFNTALAAKLSAVLLHLGAIKALAVHSEDGMDEISIASPTTVFEGSASDGVKERRIGPEDFGLTPGSPESMAGGTAEENARMALSILRGEDVPGRDVVLLNAAAGIYVAGKTGTFDDAAQRAKESINTGNAYRTLTRLAEFSNRS